MYVMCEEVRLEEDPAMVLEQPQDPKEYRSPEEVAQKGFMSMWRTNEWKDFAKRYGANLIHFDQGPMGHEVRKPTTLAVISLDELNQLQDVRGKGTGPQTEAGNQIPRPRETMEMNERIAQSKLWASWAPGLKAAIAEALRRWLFSNAPPRDVIEPNEKLKAQVMAVGEVALQQWKQHFLNDHMPARRDCSHCLRAQGRSRPHKRVEHPESFTLSLDLSGRMEKGRDQMPGSCKYVLVGVYTFPVTKSGKSILPQPGEDEPQDQPIPPPDDPALGGELALIPDPLAPDDPNPPQAENPEAEAPEDPLHEEALPDPGEPDEDVRHANSMYETWMRLVHEAKDVTVRNLTFTEPVQDRNVQNILPAIARIYARLRSLGCPVYRVHSDRAKEFISKQTKSWFLDRGIVQTMTPGSAYKTNGRVESEMNMIKKGIRTLISAGACPLERWPLAARQVGERRLRNQLSQSGWPVGRLLCFGAKAYALKKSWQDRYVQWRNCREEVVVWGPAIGTSITTTTYYVKSMTTDRCFYTDDVVIPQDALPDPNAAGADPGGDLPHLPEREDHQQAQPLFENGVPKRRLRQKTTPPAIRLSMLHIEGEKMLVEKYYNSFEFLQPPDPDDQALLRAPSEDSWTLATESTPKAPLPDDDENGGEGRVNDVEEKTKSSGSSEVERYDGGGEWEEAPNNRDGGSSPMASTCPHIMTKAQALETMHCNLADYIIEGLGRIDGSSNEQMWNFPMIHKALLTKVELEEQLHALDDQARADQQRHMNDEFLVTKTVSNKEVRDHLDDWKASIVAEYEQLVNTKKAVKPMKRTDLQAMAAAEGKDLEILPAKMVHTRKAGSGAYRSRAVVCGNYQSPTDESTYAGGADGTQVRTMLRVSAMKKWKVASTDIRTAFLNAPRRNGSRLVAMEVPYIYKLLGLAGEDEVWLILLAMYGLQASPRDWCCHRDETIPTFTWNRHRNGCDVEGYFKKTKDDNVWRLEERDLESGHIAWTGLMSVYVDDILLSGEEEAVQGALRALSSTWAMSSVEWAGINQPLKYCGFEISEDPNGDGLHVNQQMYVQEMLQRWHINESFEFPNYKVAEDEECEENPDPNLVRTAQAMAGSLRWLSTRTRPDLAHGVATMSRLMTKAPHRAVVIGTSIMKYLKGNPGIGLHYTTNVPDDWGAHGQLKVQRTNLLLEVFCWS